MVPIFSRCRLADRIQKEFLKVLAIVARFPHTVCVGNSVGTVCEGASNEDMGN
jgi:hypothetical protein